MTENIERQLIKLIATDRIDRPISSMSGKLKRTKPKLANEINLSRYKHAFNGERTYARIEKEDIMVARGMRDGIELFCEAYPRYGKILNGIIEEKRAKREIHLYFGMHEGCRLTSEDYLGVMTNLGFTEATGKSLYEELMDISYKMARARNETERSVLIGSKD